MTTGAEELGSLQAELSTLSTAEVLRWAWNRFGEGAAIGTSFQGAGLVMLHLAKVHGIPLPVFTLDTGLLFPETEALRMELERFLEQRIEVLRPEISVEAQAAVYGPELWRIDPDTCCTLRKVLPLREKLSGLDCWITGLRREQSASRAEVGVVEFYQPDTSAERVLVKLNPMVSWSREEVWAYLREHRVPYNVLHDRDYRSIGCWPCTRVAGVENDERAGRWVGFNKTECGIHTFMQRRR